MPKQKQSDKPLAPNTEAGAKAYESVLRHGFPVFRRPPHGPTGDGYRELPLNLTEISSDDLGDSLAYWTAMLNFAVEQGVLVWNDKSEIERQLKRQVNARLATGSPTLTVTEKKARAAANPEVVVLQGHSDHLQSVYNLIDAIRANCERNCVTISREITRRGGSSE